MSLTNIRWIALVSLIAANAFASRAMTHPVVSWNDWYTYSGTPVGANPEPGVNLRCVDMTVANVGPVGQTVTGRFRFPASTFRMGSAARPGVQLGMMYSQPNGTWTPVSPNNPLIVTQSAVSLAPGTGTRFTFCATYNTTVDCTAADWVFSGSVQTEVEVSEDRGAVMAHVTGRIEGHRCELFDKSLSVSAMRNIFTSYSLNGGRAF